MGNYTSPADEALFSAVGRLTISWAHLEFGLDISILILHGMLSEKYREKEIPRALKKKIKYLRKAIRLLPMDDDVLQTFMNFLDKIQDESEVRHDVIHGVVTEHIEGSGEATFTRIFHRKDGLTSSPVTADTKDILLAANRANKITSNLHALIEVLRGFEADLAKANSTPSKE